MNEASSCPGISKLSSFLDDELDEIDKTAVKLHFQSCPSCAGQLKQLEAAETLLIRRLVDAMVFNERAHKENCLTPEVMTSYFHNLLSVEEKQQAESHLDTCDSCLRELQSLAKAEAQLRDSRQEPLPESLRRRVEGLWAKSEGGKEQLARLVVRLAKEGIEIVRDALFPPAMALQEVFAPAGAYRTTEKSLLPQGVLLKKDLPGIQLSLMLRWEAENRAGLEINIEDEKLNPVVAQRVSLRRDDVLVCSERTNTDGNIIISDLEPGIYQLGTRISDKEFYFDLEINKT